MSSVRHHHHHHTGNKSSAAKSPSAKARAVLGTGLHLLGAGLSATVAALAEPDSDDDW